VLKATYSAFCGSIATVRLIMPLKERLTDPQADLILSHLRPIDLSTAAP
jgi:hypothetical protein